jgi:ATP-binding cassette subfamily B protein
MSKFRDVIEYYRSYWSLSIFSIAASSGFELLDLVVPYAIGQLLNSLSNQPLDQPLQQLVRQIADLTGQPNYQNLVLMTLLGIIFIVTVVRAPIQPWLSSWFHWDIAFRARRDHMIESVNKILTLPLEFYDENNPGRISGRVARGLSNHTWTYPEIAGQMIPKIIRVAGIFIMILLIEWRCCIKEGLRTGETW